MDFYDLKSGNNIKVIIQNRYKRMARNYSQQPESDEYFTALKIGDLVDRFDFSQVQNILKSDSTAFCWLNNYAGRVFVNVKNKKGYRYKLKDSCLGSI